MGEALNRWQCGPTTVDCEERTMTDKAQDRLDDDPPGGHDPEALADAARKFHTEKRSGDHDDDPPGGHDPEALDEAARRMQTKSD